VMMLDINSDSLREGFLQYLPIGALIGLVLLVELVLALGTWALSPTEIAAAAEQPMPPGASKIEALGDLFATLPMLSEAPDCPNLLARMAS